MSIPVSEDRVTSDDSDRSSTTLSLNIPVGVNAGEILYAVVTDSTATLPTFPAGWTTLWEKSINDTQDIAAKGAWKYADGTETGTISVTVSTNGCCGCMYRISGAANPNFDPPLGNAHDRHDDYVGDGEMHKGITCPSQHVENYDAGEEPLLLKTEDYLSIASLHQETSTYGLGVLQVFPDDYADTVNIQADTISPSNKCQMWIGERDVTSPQEVTGVWNMQSQAGGTPYSVTGLALFKGAQKTVFSSTFPFIRSAALTGESGRITSTTFKLTLAPEVKQGDYHFIVISNGRVDSPAVTLPSGWTEVVESSAYSATYGYQHCIIAFKKADGSDGRTVLIPAIAESTTCGIAFAIGNCDMDTYPPDYIGALGLGQAEDITPTHGNGNYMVMVTTAIQSDQVWANSYRADGNTTIKTWPSSDYLSRIYVDSDDELTVNENTVIAACWRDYVIDDLNTSGAVGTWTYMPETNLAETNTIAIFGTAPTEEDWWYLNWRGKGRNGTM